MVNDKYRFPFESRDNRENPLALKLGAVYPSKAVVKSIEANETCFGKILDYYRQIDKKHKALDPKVKKFFLSFYETAMGKAKEDKFGTSFYFRHFEFRISKINSEHLLGRYESFKSKLQKEDPFEDQNVLRSFLNDQEDYLISRFRLTSPEGYTLGPNSVGLDEKLTTLRDYLFIVQRGGYFYGVKENHPVVSDKKVIPISDFYNLSKKETLDVLAEPDKTILDRPVAVIPSCPSLGLDKLVEAIVK